MCLEEGLKQCHEVLGNLVYVGGVGGVFIDVAVSRTNWVVDKEDICETHPGGITRIQVHIVRTDLLEVAKSSR